MTSSLAAITYPDDFPLFNSDGYAMDMDMGLIRAQSTTLTSIQRRGYSNLPTMFTATVNVPVLQLFDFTIWLNSNVGLWVNLPLAHPFLKNNQKSEYIPARIVQLSWDSAYVDFAIASAVATIQISPTVFIDNSLESGPYDWYIAGTEGAPSDEWAIAGRAPTPSTDWAIAGGATHPGGP
jgi:hypothetical protein